MLVFDYKKLSKISEKHEKIGSIINHFLKATQSPGLFVTFAFFSSVIPYIPTSSTNDQIFYTENTRSKFHES